MTEISPESSGDSDGLEIAPQGHEGSTLSEGTAPTTPVEGDNLAPGDGGISSNPDNSSSSLPPDIETPLARAPETHLVIHETKEAMLQRLLISTAVRAHAEARELRKGNPNLSESMNQAEHSFVLLGRIVGDQKTFEHIGDIDYSRSNPLASFKDSFGDNEPRPRVMIQGGGQRAVFDNRSGGTGDTTATQLTQGVYELQTVYAKVRKDDGMVQYVCSASMSDEDGRVHTTVPVLVDENVFIESYVLAQHASIQAGLKDDKKGLSKGISGEDGNIKTIVDQVTRNAAAFAPRSLDLRAHLDLTQGIDESVLEASRAGTMMNKGDLQTLVTKLTEGNYLSDSSDLPAIEAYLKELKDGQSVPAEAVLDVLLTAGKKDMQERVDKINVSLEQLEARLTGRETDSQINQQIKKLKEEKRVIIMVMRRQKKGNPVYDLFRDMDEGRADPETSGAILDKVRNIQHPNDFFEFKAEDLNTEGTLINLIAKHYLKKAGMTEEEQNSWISDFFSKHSGDIGLMLVYMLIQTASGVIQTAVK